ncbi:CPBP family intramembrane metalloprotease [Microbacterium sp. LRZ72]|uniref:CPBP family intramembrane glutamic endopeptidase n=1 Tax=Microbacterium sp. LRZ72 TaxID=2942481 RepID=UPI0029B95C44|nr:type II CAAX endopeptidase family protein [Microbacterium sp. LRZ72]MDX2377988.1 CPBP family intramembrane metalloprotease [Microbacterium sp. LRZ72]
MAHDTRDARADPEGAASERADPPNTASADADSADRASADPDAARAEQSARRRGRRRPRHWTEGGSSVRPWGWDLLGWALVGYALGLLGAAAIRSFAPDAAVTSAAAAVALWIGMGAPIVLAFSRSRPRGLLRFRAVDLLYGVALGLALRLTQGWLAEAENGAPLPFPSYPSLDGGLPASWWFADLLTPVVISPVIEEFFFRGVLLVALFAALRGALGAVSAGVVALLATTGLFVVAHALGGALGADAVAAYALVGLVCGLLVLLTGRIWGAILTHAVFNALWVALATTGTLLA